MQLERKVLDFSVTETKEDTVNGVKIGIIEGYASTWDKDRGDDIIEKGAFSGTLKDHAGKSRMIRMLFGHDYKTLIGGFPVEMSKEDARGLYVVGQVNLETEAGKDAYALAKQGVLTDMSIGFSIPRGASEMKSVEGKMCRIIKKIDLYEISLVPEPMNEKANILAVKSLYQKRNIEMPADGSINVQVVEACETVGHVEELLREVGFTANAAKAMISRFKKSTESREGVTEQMGELALLLREGAKQAEQTILISAING